MSSVNKRRLVGTIPTLSIMGDEDQHLSTINIKNGLNCRRKFSVWRRQEVVRRVDDRELITRT